MERRKPPKSLEPLIDLLAEMVADDLLTEEAERARIEAEKPKPKRRK